ncbi:HpcH/HpaI aldolase family protein [Oceaniglobus trochenteri]|uniref:HpcH/HpaI aldolase family protein n=1 Tax=Oceaniglobus trochenteri TaxID=2763260 RepID=UPI001CFFE23B|nr:aldolase/citrate lyase family protein [Oceaniglobus trochenteri]
MRTNPMRKLWADDKPVLNLFLSIPSSYIAEVAAHQGFDSLTVDLQHGLHDLDSATTSMQAISTTSTVPLARVQSLEPGAISAVLDRGAYGVICPMINTREEAENLVRYAKYPPHGERSFGPIRGLLYGGPDYVEHANDEIVTIAMIETREAIDNLDDILSVAGLDAVYIGPSDLALSLGYRPGVFDGNEEMSEAIDTVARIAAKHRKIAGSHAATPEMARRFVERGFRFVTVLSDAKHIGTAMGGIVKEFRD